MNFSLSSLLLFLFLASACRGEKLKRDHKKTVGCGSTITITNTISQQRNFYNQLQQQFGQLDTKADKYSINLYSYEILNITHAVQTPAVCDTLTENRLDFLHIIEGTEAKHWAAHTVDKQRPGQKIIILQSFTECHIAGCYTWCCAGATQQQMGRGGKNES